LFDDARNTIYPCGTSADGTRAADGRVPIVVRA